MSTPFVWFGLDGRMEAWIEGILVGEKGSKGKGMKGREKMMRIEQRKGE